MTFFASSWNALWQERWNGWGSARSEQKYLGGPPITKGPTMRRPCASDGSSQEACTVLPRGQARPAGAYRTDSGFLQTGVRFHGLLLRFQTVSQLLPEHSDAKQKLDSAIEQAAAAITECRDAGIARFHSGGERSGDGHKHASEKRSKPARPAIGRHSMSRLRVNREICAWSCVTRFTRLQPRRCGTPFGTRRHKGSKSNSVTTTSNSDYVCGTMEKV
jgi:hypothetical protein